MPRVNSENVGGVEGLRLLTGCAFSDLIPLGRCVGETRRLSGLDAMPRGKKGVYTVWVSDGSAGPLLVYGGKCAAEGEGIRHRIRTELNPRQNELAPSETKRRLQGPTRVYLWLRELGVDPKWHISFVELADACAIDRVEQSMLMRIDFISNTQFNGVLRLEALDGYFKQAAAAPAATTVVVGPAPEMVVVPVTEKPKKVVKKAKKPDEPATTVTEVKDEIAAISFTLRAIESDPEIARAALVAVGKLRAKLGAEIVEMEARLAKKRCVLDSLTL